MHPTPAICGLPKTQAFDFITEQENYDRSLFTGFLGPINFGTKIALYVNIRCAQILEKNAIVYAGAGIVPASEPMDEWMETEAKCAVMKKNLEKCFEHNV